MPTWCPEIYKKYIKYAVDDKTARESLSLWRGMNLLVQKEGKLRPGRLILPTVIAYWNRCKGPIDLYSRYLANVQAKHGKISPNGRIWIRLLMTCVYNAYHSYALYKMLPTLGDLKSYTEFQRLKHRTAGTFTEFFSCLSDSLTTPTEGEIVTNTASKKVENIILQNHRGKFYTDPDLINARLDTRRDHRTATICSRDGKSSSQKCCVWCCSRDHNPESEKINDYGMMVLVTEGASKQRRTAMIVELRYVPWNVIKGKLALTCGMPQRSLTILVLSQRYQLDKNEKLGKLMTKTM